MLILTAASLLTAPGAGAQTSDSATSKTMQTTPRVSKGQTGPWGALEYTRITLEPPPDLLEIEADDTFTTAAWIFRGMERPQVEALFRFAGLSEAQHRRMTRETEWQQPPGATLVFPQRDLILALEPSARERIYSVLARFEENEAQAQPFTFQPGLLEEYLERSGLRDATVKQFRRLLFPRGERLLFADSSPFMATLPDKAERTRFFDVISRRLTLLVKLRVTPASDVDQLHEYWSHGTRRKELRALFESMARVPEGCSIDIAHLLPPYARRHVYTFSDPSQNLSETKRNCHWTAFNFFNDPPDDRLADPAFIPQVVQNEYEQVTSPSWRLGDVIVLFDSNEDSVHSAVYLADTIVFTKNGNAHGQPWVYMHLQDMLDSYTAATPPEAPLQMTVLRKRQR